VHDERQRLAALHERLAETMANEVPAPTPAAPAPTPAASARPDPDWRSLLPPLPAYLTRLFGAEQSVAHTQALVRGSRLVTLLGPGGSGKTRLAVEVVQALRDGAPGPSDPAAALFARTAFVSLVSCEQAPRMLAAMARALQLPADAGDDSARLVEALAGRRPGRARTSHARLGTGLGARAGPGADAGPGGPRAAQRARGAGRRRAIASGGAAAGAGLAQLLGRRRPAGRTADGT
jgi:hypothetical protein